mgnify:CR=1 FL=1
MGSEEEEEDETVCLEMAGTVSEGEVQSVPSNHLSSAAPVPSLCTAAAARVEGEARRVAKRVVEEGVSIHEGEVMK